MNYNDLKWQNDMKIRLDFNNMMAEFVGEKEGYTDADLVNNANVAKSAFDGFNAIRGTGMTGWADLP